MILTDPNKKIEMEISINERTENRLPLTNNTICYVENVNYQ